MPLFINKVMVAGNMTRDVEARSFGESTVANFGLAINRRYKGRDGEQKEEATFLDVECWGRTAELAAQYLEKGRNVHIEGRLKLDQWEDKQDGSKRSKLKVVADRIDFIGSANDNTGGGERRTGPAPAAYDAAPTGARIQTSAGDIPAAPDLGDDSPPF